MGKMTLKCSAFSLFFFFLIGLLSADPGAFPSLPKSDSERAAYAEFLKSRYNFDTNSLRWGEKYPVVVNGSDEKSFTPPQKFDKNPTLVTNYDTVIVGGGSAGLASAFFLTRDKNYKVLLLEKEQNVGGLAIGSSLVPIGHYGRGGAYFTAVEGPAREVYREIGMSDYEKRLPIPEPIDSYYWNGKYYRGLWESEKAMEELPADFAVLKFCLQQADREKLIPNQPIEQAPGTQTLDKMNFLQWINTFPEKLRQETASTDPKVKEAAEKLLARYEADPRIDKKNPMGNVEKLLQNFGRSALGDHPEFISAAAFANFYISEISTRYTSSVGAGFVPQTIIKQLKTRPNYVQITGAPVSEVVTTPEGVSVYFVKEGKTFLVKAKNAVFAAPLHIAPKLIPQLASMDPEKKKKIDALQMRDYEVVNLHVKGHPWKDTYDLWVRDDKTYSQEEPTDIIDGRWMDFKGGELPRTDDKGVITVYMPLSKKYVGKGYDEKTAIQIAERMADKTQTILNPLIKERGGEPMQILAVEANRWPYSIHLAAPGHFLNDFEALARPLGNIYFANNNLGTPAVEEAVYRGWLAVEEIQKKARSQAKKQSSRYSPTLDRLLNAA
jgi:monoamine oxidase